MKILVITGTRPEIIKMSPIIYKCNLDPEIDLIHVDTTQHYDYDMNLQFFEELDLPKPDYSLTIERSNMMDQISSMMLEVAKVIEKVNPDLVLLQGDTNTVMVSAIVARNLNMTIGHVEAGIRSYDLNMPEEINRKITDLCSNIHFCPTNLSGLNLLFEGIEPHRIFMTGNTIVDAVNRMRPLLLKKKEFTDSILDHNFNTQILVTLHRPSNVDNKKKLNEIIKSFETLPDCQFIIPIHPRTRKNLKKYNYIDRIKKLPNVNMIKPLGYLDFLSLLTSVNLVVTDSGGIQEECLCLKKRCLTLRDNTERPETIFGNSNTLIEIDRTQITTTIQKLINGDNHTFFPEILGKGDAADNILRIIKSTSRDFPFRSPIMHKWKDYQYKLEMITKDISMSMYEQKRERSIIMVYNDLGEPMLPYSDIQLKKDYKVVSIGKYRFS